jgi:hypothetical protein
LIPEIWAKEKIDWANNRQYFMSVDQAEKIDFYGIDKATDDLWLTISDHLPWDKDEGEHLVILQDKLNAYLRFIESGEIFGKVPDARGRKIGITLVGKFPLSEKARLFFEQSQVAIKDAGFHLQFNLIRPN